MQGDIVSKLWIYKDKLGRTQGPFMSYDMDIWNGEGNYFAEDLKIALLNSPFLPLQMYLDRAQIVIDVVQNFLLKHEQSGKDQSAKGSFEGPRRNQSGNNSSKKYTFHKKSETEKEAVAPQNNYRTPAELSNNFAENFPPLADSLAKVALLPKMPSDKPGQTPALALNMRTTSTPGEPSLLDTLRSTFKDSNVQTEARKISFQEPLAVEVKAPQLPAAPKPEPSKPSSDNKISQETKPTVVAPSIGTVQPQEARTVVPTKNQAKKESTPVQSAKPVVPQNIKKGSTKKVSKRGKNDLADQYNRQNDELNYVEKLDVPEKPVTVQDPNHSDLTLSIKSLLGLNLK